MNPNDTHIRQYPAHRRMKLDAYAAVLAAVRNGASTRRAIQQAALLSWGATSQCVKTLLEAGLLVERPPTEAPPPPDGSRSEGRRPTVLAANADAPLVAGIEVYEQSFSAVVLDLAGRTVAESSRGVTERIDNANLAGFLSEFLTALPAGIARVHLVLTGAVDETNRIWHASPHVPGIAGFTAEALPGNYDWHFEHDITARARELRRREHSGAEGVFLHLGRGIGMSVWSNGEFLKGARGFAGEIGHLPGLGGTRTLEREIRLDAIAEACALPSVPTLENWTERLDADALERVYRYLTPRLEQLLLIGVNLFDPAEILIGGEIVAPFLARIETDGNAFIRRHGWMASPARLRGCRIADGDAARGSALPGIEALGLKLLQRLV